MIGGSQGGKLVKSEQFCSIPAPVPESPFLGKSIPRKSLILITISIGCSVRQRPQNVRFGQSLCGFERGFGLRRLPSFPSNLGCPPVSVRSPPQAQQKIATSRNSAGGRGTRFSHRPDTRTT